MHITRYDSNGCSNKNPTKKEQTFRRQLRTTNKYTNTQLQDKRVISIEKAEFQSNMLHNYEICTYKMPYHIGGIRIHTIHTPCVCVYVRVSEQIQLPIINNVLIMVSPVSIRLSCTTPIFEQSVRCLSLALSVLLSFTTRMVA